jgi:hypothetical protein
MGMASESLLDEARAERGLDGLQALLVLAELDQFGRGKGAGDDLTAAGD